MGGRPRLGIQLYTVRSFSEPLPEVVRSVSETSFSGVEFAHRLRESDLERVAEALEETDIDPVGLHVGLDEIENEPRRVAERCRAIGADTAVLPHVSRERFANIRSVETLAGRLNDAGSLLADRGIDFVYHNQAHDFLRLEGESVLDRLAAATDRDLVAFELDVGAAVVAGVDPVRLLDRYEGRCPLVHIKDVLAPDPSPTAAQVSAPLGTGDLPRSGVVDSAVRNDVEWLVFENDDPEDARTALSRGGRTLEELTMEAVEDH